MGQALKEHAELDAQDTDEVFRQFNLLHEEMTDVKNMLSLLLVQKAETSKAA
jgi:hypothetical protein